MTVNRLYCWLWSASGASLLAVPMIMGSLQVRATDQAWKQSMLKVCQQPPTRCSNLSISKGQRAVLPGVTLQAVATDKDAERLMSDFVKASSLITTLFVTYDIRVPATGTKSVASNTVKAEK